MLAALRELGIEKLKELISVSGANSAQKTKLEGYAKEIVNCIS